jgi:hypothetical protein
MKVSTAITWAALIYIIYEMSQSAHDSPSSMSGVCGPGTAMALPVTNPAWIRQLNGNTHDGGLIFGGLG